MPTLVMSLDYSKEDIIERMLACESGIDSLSMRRGLVSFEQWESRIYPAASHISAGTLSIDDSSGTDLPELLARARHFRKYNDRDVSPANLVIVDHLERLRKLPPDPGANDVDGMNEALAALKELAKELAAPVLASLQSVSKSTANTGSLASLGEQASDLPLVLRRAEVAGEVPGRTDLIIRKNIHGPTGTVHLK